MSIHSRKATYAHLAKRLLHKFKSPLRRPSDFYTFGFPWRSILTLIFVLSEITTSTLASSPTDTAKQIRFTQTVDMLSAIYLPANQELFFCGKSGVVGKLLVVDGGLESQIIETGIKEDFLVAAVAPDEGVLVGSSKGNIFRYQNSKLEKLAGLSDYDEPILDIYVGPEFIWASGGRGLMAQSSDGGHEWSHLIIESVEQPSLDLPSREPGVWYLGASNIDLSSVVFSAQVNGKQVVLGEDFEIDVEEGRLIIRNALDDKGPASIGFNFNPGPPYRGGDVAWNVVIAQPEVLTIAGEFGLILQSYDKGQQWVRRNGEITREEPGQLYWLSGASSDNSIILGGAAGVIYMSKDTGLTWSDLDLVSQEGVFGVNFVNSDTPIIAGAVGLLGIYQDGQWKMADRTALGLRSWIKNLVHIGNDTWVALGGRSTALSFSSDSGWEKLNVMIASGEAQ